MALDLNKVAERLRNQKPMGVTRDGRLQESDPKNDGTREDNRGNTTLKPKRFFSN